MALWLTIGHSALVHGEDVLARTVRFHIEPAPLSRALIEFSSQSGVQLVTADADLANLQTGGVSGKYTIGAALDRWLLHTGLATAPVGSDTIAIRRASAGPAIGEIDRNQQPTALPDVAVFGPTPPPGQLLTQDHLFQFGVHHATTHYPSSNGNVGGSLVRWRGGRSGTVCPRTEGLDRGYNDFVTARIRALAAYVGAPVSPDARCAPNVQIMFTATPQTAMESILRTAARALRVSYPHQVDRELKESAKHAIQGWYVTAGGGAALLNTDANFVGSVALLPLWPYVIPTGNYGSRAASRGIVEVVIVVDTTQVAGSTIGSIADYMAMLALTLVQSPDHCDALPSILDLTSTGCDSRERPAGITAVDLAFLKALYFENTGIGPTLSRDEMVFNMSRQFKDGGK